MGYWNYISDECRLLIFHTDTCNIDWESTQEGMWKAFDKIGTTKYGAQGSNPLLGGVNYSGIEG